MWFRIQEQVEVIAASRTATSTESLRGMPPPTVSLGAVRAKKPIRLNPNVLVSLGPARRDPVLQSSVSRRRPASRAPRGAEVQTPIPGKNLEGIGEGFRGPQGEFSVQTAPPDTSGAVGTTQYVQFVNGAFAVFNKSTGLPSWDRSRETFSGGRWVETAPSIMMAILWFSLTR